MAWKRWRLVLALVCLVAPVAALSGQGSGQAREGQQSEVTIEWLGHMFFRLTDPNGTVVLTSPWLDPQGNRDVPITLEEIDRADLLLLPNSHRDDIGNPIEISARTGARSILPRGLSAWQVGLGMDPGVILSAEVGDTFAFNGLRIDVVENIHDNTFRIGDEAYDGGPAHGHIVTFSNGFTVYFAASSSVNPKMADYARQFRPHVALIHVNSVVGATELLKTDNPNLQTVIPTHLPFGDPRAAQLAEEVAGPGLGVRLLHPFIGEVLAFSMEPQTGRGSAN